MPTEGFIVDDDGSSNRAQVDNVSNSLQSIDYVHHMIHAGKHFNFNYIDADVDDTEVIELRLAVPAAVYPHMLIELQCTVSVTASLYEGTTKTAGTAASSINSNRNSATAASMVITHTPGGSGDGTLLLQELLGGSAGANNRGTMTQSSGRNELILKAGTVYLLRLASNENNNRVTIKLSWYEP